MPAQRQQQPLERPCSGLMQVAQALMPSPESKHGERHASQSVNHTSPKPDPLVLAPVNLGRVGSNV